jgi:hypothetical protein
MKIAIGVVAGVTLIVLVLCSIGMGFMSMVIADGFMKNTNQMAISYAICNGVSVLGLVILNGWLVFALNKYLNLNVWLGGLASICISMALFGIVMFMAVFVILIIFGS